MDQKLTSKAREQIESLQRQIAQVVNADRTRDPKLTTAEKLEIDELQKVITQYSPWVESLGKQTDETRARLEGLRVNYPGLIFEGKFKPEAVANELLYLPVLHEVLFETFRNASGTVSTAAARIEKIKENARQREA